MGIGAIGEMHHVVIVPYEKVDLLLDGAKEQCGLLKNSIDSLQNTISEQAIQLSAAENTIKTLETSLLESSKQLEKMSPIFAKLQHAADKATKAWGYIQPVVSHPAFLAATGLSALYCGYKTVQTLAYPAPAAVHAQGQANRAEQSSLNWLAKTIISTSACALSIYARTT